MGNFQTAKIIHARSHYEGNNHLKVLKFRYEWTIENFKDLALATGSFSTSERLKVDLRGQTDEWEVVFYPKGFNQRTANYVSVWLKRVSNIERLVQFTCQIPKTKGGDLRKKSVKKKLALESFLGWSAFCKRSHILENEAEVLKNGSLVLVCNLEVYDDKCISHAAIEDGDPKMDARLSTLSKNFKELLQNHKHYDVVFEVERKKFYAHKAVLAARSPVFCTMFHSQLEKENRNILVTDIDSETFASMLLFIYSGEWVEKEFEAIFRLYYASDKYEILSLRQICSMMLIENLNSKNAIQVADLANKHCDKILEDAAVHFLAKHSKEIQRTRDWQDLMKYNPSLVNNVFGYLVNNIGSVNLRNLKI